jgi:hypothetical protein
MKVVALKIAAALYTSPPLLHTTTHNNTQQHTTTLQHYTTALVYIKLPMYLLFIMALILNGCEGCNIITRGTGRSGPKKVSIFRAHLFRCPS